MDERQKMWLQELKQLYPIEFAKYKLKSGTNDLEKIVWDMTAYHLDRQFVGIANELRQILPEEKTIKLLTAVMAKIYGQMIGNYDINNNNTYLYRYLFNSIAKKYMKENKKCKKNKELTLVE